MASIPPVESPYESGLSLFLCGERWVMDMSNYEVLSLMITFGVLRTGGSTLGG